MKAERKQRTRIGLRSIRLHALTAAAACFFATATTGCVSHHGDNAVIESHFTRLEQTCFGYEPTVWRTMSGQCESAVRQIPEPVIYLPKSRESTTTPSTEPQESALDSVPEPGQEPGEMGLFKNLFGPPVTPNNGSDPSSEPVPDTEPLEDPTEEPTPAPAAPPAAPPAPQFSFSSSRQAVTVPAATRESAPASTGSAKQLFATLESVLGDSPQPARAPTTAPKNGPTGLAKFISY